MPEPRFAHPFRSRFANLRAMALNPSYRAPRAAEVLHPPPFTPPQAPRLSEEERALLDDVIEGKDDDAARLRYAVWCEANGKAARAAFIRAQLAGIDAMPDPAWAAIFEPWCARDLVYRRGFVEAMSLAGRAFIALGEPLFCMTPLREVRLVAVAPFLRELAAAPHLNRLEILNLRGNRIGDDGLKIITASQHFSRLHKLDLRDNSLTDSVTLVSLRLRGVEIIMDEHALQRAA